MYKSKPTFFTDYKKIRQRVNDVGLFVAKITNVARTHLLLSVRANGVSDSANRRCGHRTANCPRRLGAFSPAFFKRRQGQGTASLVAVRRLRNSYYFQKAGGAKNSPVDCFSVGNPRKGFPVIFCFLFFENDS